MLSYLIYNVIIYTYIKYLLSMIYDYNSNPSNKWTIKNINGGIQRDNISCGLFTLMLKNTLI